MSFVFAATLISDAELRSNS